MYKFSLIKFSKQGCTGLQTDNDMKNVHAIHLKHNEKDINPLSTIGMGHFPAVYAVTSEQNVTATRTPTHVHLYAK